jgi:hypothetical protein
MKNLKNKVSEIKEVAELKNTEKVETTGGHWLVDLARAIVTLLSSDGTPQV